ncbi:MAG TPA: hypothetical protein DCZ07_09130 [Alphaproteobacteria bacterium]|nr:hypothetical protein [Alphaproteobacteria bacterium]
MTDNMTSVLEDISRSKVSNRAVFVREILKMLDDAHFSGHRPTSDVIFIDSASFLEKGWRLIAPYSQQIAPIDMWDSWSETASETNPVEIS